MKTITLNCDQIHSLGINEALMVAALKTRKKDEDGWRNASIDAIEEITGMTRATQLRAIKKLAEKNIIETSVRGIPPRRFLKFVEGDN